MFQYHSRQEPTKDNPTQFNLYEMHKQILEKKEQKRIEEHEKQSQMVKQGSKPNKTSELLVNRKKHAKIIEIFINMDSDHDG